MKRTWKLWLCVLALVAGVAIVFPLARRWRREYELGRAAHRLAETREQAVRHRDLLATFVGPDGQPTAVTLSLRDARDRAVKLLEDEMPDRPIILAAYTATQPSGTRSLVLYLLDPKLEMNGIFVEGKDGKIWEFPDLLDWAQMNEGDESARVFSLAFQIGPDDEPSEGATARGYEPDLWLTREDMGGSPKVGLLYRGGQRTEAIACLFRVHSEETLVVDDDEMIDDE